MKFIIVIGLRCQCNDGDFPSCSYPKISEVACYPFCSSAAERTDEDSEIQTGSPERGASAWRRLSGIVLWGTY